MMNLVGRVESKNIDANVSRQSKTGYRICIYTTLSYAGIKLPITHCAKQQMIFQTLAVNEKAHRVRAGFYERLRGHFTRIACQALPCLAWMHALVNHSKPSSVNRILALFRKVHPLL